MEVVSAILVLPYESCSPIAKLPTQEQSQYRALHKVLKHIVQPYTVSIIQFQELNLEISYFPNQNIWGRTQFSKSHESLISMNPQEQLVVQNISKSGLLSLSSSVCFLVYITILLSILLLLFKGLPLFGILIFLIQKYPYTPIFMQR